MSIPQKQSRTITIQGKTYRWLVSRSHGRIHLTIENTSHRGQLLRVSFEPHQSYRRDSEGNWKSVFQGRKITPQVVKQFIEHGLANAWASSTPGKPPFQINIWQADKIAPPLPPLSKEEYRLKDMACDQVCDLQFDLSLDPNWRLQLFKASFKEKIPIPDNYVGLNKKVRECGLRFYAFQAGWTNFGFVVFGIGSVDFPEVVMYTTNNPDIL